ncbi:MAG: hypothetical protein AAF945_06430 [Actinomycetota bacterium]
MDDDRAVPSRSDLARAVRRRGLQVVDPLHTARRAVYVTGSARSGTTWVAEVLAGRRSTRFVFEPLHHRSLAARVAPIPHFQVGAEPARIRGLIDDALTGRTHDPWVNTFQRRGLMTRRVVKDIRPALLGEVRDAAPEVPAVLVVRDPFDAALSRARHEGPDGRWFATNAAIAELRGLVADRRVGVLGDLARRAVATLDGPFGRHPLAEHVVIWCVENRIALERAEDRRPGDRPIAVVSYESMRSDPDGGFALLAAELGVPRRRLGDPHVRSSTDFRVDHGAVTAESGIEAAVSGVDPRGERPIDPVAVDEVVDAFGLRRTHDARSWTID